LKFLLAILFMSFFECFQESKVYEKWWYLSLLYLVQKYYRLIDEETDFKNLWENCVILTKIIWKDADENNY